MAQHTMTDNAAGSPIWVLGQMNKAINTANRTALYNNVTSGGYFTGRTDGTFGVNPTEMTVSVAEAAGGLQQVRVTNAGTGIIDLDPWPSVSIAGGSGQNTTVYLKVTDAEIDNVGTGFVPGELLTYPLFTATNTPEITLNVVSVGAVTATRVANGANYANGDTIALVGGNGETIATFTVTTGAATTNVATLALDGAGSYTSIPTGTIATTNVTGSGSGLTVTATWGIDEVEIIEAGNTWAGEANSETVASTTSGDGTGDRLTLLFGVAHVGINNTGSGYANGAAVTASPAALTGESFLVTVNDGVSPGNPVAHAGWQLRTVGSGGRAGRVFYETLVAGSSMNAGTSDDTQFPNS